MGVQYPIPGNDDAIRAISFYCEIVAKTVLNGISASLSRNNKDKAADDKQGKYEGGGIKDAEKEMLAQASKSKDKESASNKTIAANEQLSKKDTTGE